MSKERININPKLSEIHNNEFITFCRNLKTQLLNKSQEQKEAFIYLEKEKIDINFRGKNFHSNTDLEFVESLLLDLLLQDWELNIEQENIFVELNISDNHNKDLAAEKAKTRRRHLLSRDNQLNEPSVTDFIKNMERRRLTSKGWHSIFSLMRDGNELKNQLNLIKQIVDEQAKLSALSKVVKPYIQFVEPNTKCEETGLPLSDIWRYFRHTWTNEYKSLPGRSMSILIRDAAVPNHPIIGIAALGSSIAQQTCRDEWIGWDGKTFIEKIKKEPSAKYAKWIINTIQFLLEDIYLKDFFKESIITLSDVRKPSVEIIKKLRDASIEFRKRHVDNPEISKFTTGNNNLSWEDRAQTNLFKSKRAVSLAEVLSIKLVLNKYEFTKGTKKELETCLQNNDFSIAVEKLIRKVKAIHVGINMMDIIVCGSIAPYNHLLGGKLVCMLLTSPEVNGYYNKKYAESVSLIASSMKGKAVTRKPQLVMLATTSLYGAGSSQYNRIKIPAAELGSHTKSNIEYKELGFSEGYGSFHFSKNTLQLAGWVAGRESGMKKVNSIFGEGANPLLRKVKDAMEFLKLESNPILNHRNKRVVYGITLAENFGDILSGISEKPRYITQQTKPKEKTKSIANYWIKRWLLNRTKNDEVIQKVGEHTLSYPVVHGAKVPISQFKSESELF